MNGRPETMISDHECIAMRELHRGEYTKTELAFLFECKVETVSRHVNKDCQHNRLQQKTHQTGKQEYSTKQCIKAFRHVYDRQPFEKMSQGTYDEYRPDDFPSSGTIHRRFSSWAEVRRIAHNE